MPSCGGFYSCFQVDGAHGWRNIAITLVDPVGYSCLAPLTSLLTHCARAMAVVLPAHFLTHRARALAVVRTAGALADRADAVVVVLAASLFAHRAHTIVTVISPELVFIGHAEHSSLFRNRIRSEERRVGKEC